MVYRAMFLSLRIAATKEIIAMLYINMRWYQHNLHGAYPTLSLKYKLPTIAPVVIMQINHNPEVRTWCNQFSAHCCVPPKKVAHNVTTPPANVASAKMALNSCTASLFTVPFCRVAGQKQGHNARLHAVRPWGFPSEGGRMKG
jgi:hypothetical protein